MPTAMENAIEALSDPNVSLPDALRRLLVVSRRIGADELSQWLRGELNGYASDAEVPTYRAGRHLPIKLQYDGLMGGSISRSLTAAELPDRLSNVMEGMAFREPVAELEALTRGDADPQLTLPVAWIALYRQLAEEGKVPSMEMMILNHAGVTMPRTHLTGILDRVKSTALDLALSLEDVSPQVGDTGGPTTADEPRLEREVQVHLTQLFANGSTITIGDHATIASGESATAIRVDPGDIDGLLRAATTFLQPDGVESLAEALRTDGNQPAEATRRFLDRVKNGGYLLAGGVAGNAAYDGLVALLKQAFPGVFS
ncbi:hypothetical protein [Phytoactinopolyspora limicola]|uniref:AbiTii domain-containing protein n=1 Tax=Phytoactinopolyspora limicola TaxID=2715536 RepID=UPI001407CD82|nr:hypothetical protein [Phytoactinopolyspora limicola]